MPSPSRTTTLSDVLDSVDEAARGQPSLSVGELQAAMGRRAFGPLLLLPALVIVSPLSGIPTLPTATAAIVALVAGQILIGSEVVWLPRRLRRLSLTHAQVAGAVRFLRPVARVVDRVVKPRLEWATGPLAMKVVALVCLMIALTMPPLELLPFVSSIAAAVIALFALALTAHDGLLILFGLLLTSAGAAAAVAAVTAVT